MNQLISGKSSLQHRHLIRSLPACASGRCTCLVSWRFCVEMRLPTDFKNVGEGTNVVLRNDMSRNLRGSGRQRIASAGYISTRKATILTPSLVLSISVLGDKVAVGRSKLRIGLLSMSRLPRRAGRIKPHDHAVLQDNIRFAMDLGAEVVKLKGRRVADAVIDFARKEVITHVTFGQSARSRWDVSVVAS